jgi:hypothetical protein
MGKKSRSLVVNDAGRSNPRKRKSGKGRMAVYGAAYNQLRSDVSHLMSMLNVEDKYVDNSGTTTLSAAWQTVLLNALAQGTGSSQRMGQSVKVVGIEFRFTLYLAAAGTSSTTRLILFRDSQANAALPTVTQVFPVDVTAPRVVAYLDRFHIDREEVMTLTTSGDNAVHRTFTFNKSFHIDFNTANLGTIADIVTNSYFVAFVSDAAANFPVITYTSRVVYVDN